MQGPAARSRLDGGLLSDLAGQEVLRRLREAGVSGVEVVEAFPCEEGVRVTCLFNTSHLDLPFEVLAQYNRGPEASIRWKLAIEGGSGDPHQDLVEQLGARVEKALEDILEDFSTFDAVRRRFSESRVKGLASS